MKHIRKRPPIHTLVNQQRVETAAWGRRIYAGLLGMGGLLLLNYLLGDFFMLRADGILVTDKTIVGATYPGKVDSVFVKEGQRVKKGDVLLRLDSAEMLKDLADLMLRSADLGTRNAELKTRMTRVQGLLPLAERNANETAESIVKYDAMSNRGLVRRRDLNDALKARLDSAGQLAELKGQEAVLRDELPLVADSYKQADEALARLQALYNEGIVKAATDGVIGPRIPWPGQVFKLGDELLQIHGSQQYVLAYLSDDYLFNVSAGQRVAVNAGHEYVAGYVESVLVADALPPEFQNTFRPRDRGRLLRIVLDNPNNLAVSQKVRVSSCWTIWCR